MEKRNLTDQASKITDFYRARKRMPTYAEMMTILGYKTKSAVHYFVDKLVDAGIVEKDRDGRLIPRSLGDLKLLGVVEAGFPTSASEEMLDTMSLDEFLIGNKEATYMLKVKGESMKDAGILPGDMVVVERGREPKLGEIVIAEVDGDYTMKYYKKDKSGRVYLEPANEAFEPIYPENDLSIAAVVKAVIRKF